MVDQAKPLSKIQEELEKLFKNLELEKERLEKRHEMLSRINADLNGMEVMDIPSEEDINRLEGYFSYIISYDLKDLIERKNWFVGVILSSAILEDVGKRKLKRKFKDKICSNRIQRLSFEQVIIMLLASGLVDSKVYQKLMDIKGVRNDLAHDSFEAMSSFLQTGSMGNEVCKKCKSAIKKAIVCLETINPPVTPKLSENQSTKC